MSHLHSRSLYDHHAVKNEIPVSRFAGEIPSLDHPTDRAIDSALRSVPLPDGLLTRLGKLVYTMPDDTADQVDCLGC